MRQGSSQDGDIMTKLGLPLVWGKYMLSLCIVKLQFFG